MDALLQKLAASLSNRSSGWWARLTGYLLAAVALLVGWWILRRNSRELARLRIEKFQSKVAADEAAFQMESAKDWRAASVANARSNAALAQAFALEAQIEVARKQHGRDVDTIRAIKSWKDVQ